jgi:hypothetical protein
MSLSDDERTVLVPGGESAPAPVWPSAPSQRGNAFPAGARLGEFDITGLLGEGGFGIVYLAWDSSLERQVALKEYMPSSFASRSSTMQVAVTSARDQETFDAGLRSFVNEARILAQFDHPSLIKVYRFWEANGTAYMVMPYYQGATLKQTLLARGTAPDEAWLKALLAPLLDTLSLIHAHQCFHRDIAPDNIMMLPSGRPLLLDFGAARRAVEGMQQAFTVIFKQNYAPIEQYAEMPGMSQGPWTDLYALASVVHFAMTGTAPPPAVGRLVQDPYVPLAQRCAGGFSTQFLRAIDQALAVKPEDRPQSAEALRALLGLSAAIYHHPAPAPPAPAPITAAPAARTRTPLLLGAAGATLLAAIAVGVFVARDHPAPAVAAAQPLPQTAPAPVPVPVPFTPLSALQQVVAGASPERAVTASAARPRVQIERDLLDFTVRTSHAGYLYVQMVSTDGHFILLFPNAKDQNNAIKAGQTWKLPRAGWNLVFAGPAGMDHFVAIVADAPRDFAQAGLLAGDAFSEFPLARAQALHAAYTGTTPLFAGTPACEGVAACPASYGASMFSVEEVAR